MTNQISDAKLVLKVAQNVWAANKYYVLACCQQSYNQIRQYLRPDQLDLTAAYEVLAQVEQEFKSINRAQLPQIENSLFHLAGYFKQIYTDQERQQMHRLIQENPEEALKKLECSTFQHHVSYLEMSRLWPSEQHTAFDENREEIKHKGMIYPPHAFRWHREFIYKTEGET